MVIESCRECLCPSVKLSLPDIYCNGPFRKSWQLVGTSRGNGTLVVFDRTIFSQLLRMLYWNQFHFRIRDIISMAGPSISRCCELVLCPLTRDPWEGGFPLKMRFAYAGMSPDLPQSTHTKRLTKAVGDDGRRLKEGVICNTGAKEHTSDRNEAFPARPNEQAQTGICLGRRPPLEDVIVGISGCDTGESRAKARESLASPEITFCACTNHCPCSPFSFQYGTLISGVKGCSLTIMPGTKRYSFIACTMKRFLLARTRSLPASLLADD